jgi:hypothetical protein
MGLVTGAFAAFVALPAARADDKAACIEADANGQELRLKGQWHDAELRFKTCTRLACPDAIVEDCVHRYDELQAAMPSLLVSAKQPDGSDTVDARLFIDGAPVATLLPATAVEVNPGEHGVRVEHDGWTAPEQTVVVLEREKGRHVVFQFQGPPPPPARDPGPNLLGIGLTAGGGLATGVGILFLALGFAERSTLLGSSCAATRTCSPDDVNTVSRDFAIGGIVTGIGLAVAGVGLWELFLKPDTRARVGVTPSGLGVAF